MELIFDSHAHYDDPAFNEDREEILSGLFERGVGNVVNICANLHEIDKTLALAAQYDFMYAAVGVHPTECYDLKPEDEEVIRAALPGGAAFLKSKVVAVGEIGLDYHYPDTDKAKQKDWFARQIALAKETHLPIVVHSRDAAADTLDMMIAEGAKDVGGVIHCFSYEPEMAKRFLDLGFYIGIGGVVTFKKSRKLKETAQMMPMDRMLIETDCPYLAPEPFRGKRNDSTLLSYVAEELAALCEKTPEKIIRITAENARRMYNILD